MANAIWRTVIDKLSIIINDDYIVLYSDKKSRTNESLENYGHSRRKVTVLFHY